MNANATTLHVPVDEDTRRKAADALSAAGLSIPQAVQMFLSRVVEENGYPAALKVPNAETVAAMTEASVIAQDRRARFNSTDELFISLEKRGGQ